MVKLVGGCQSVLSSKVKCCEVETTPRDRTEG